jgi:hypothetical protein
MGRDAFDVDSLEAKAFFRCKRALAHLMNKNHEFKPLESNPVGVDGDVPL